MNRSLYTRFRSAYLVLDGIRCDDWAQNVTKNNRQKRYVKLGFSQLKKKYVILSGNFYSIYIDHHEKLRYYK